MSVVVTIDLRHCNGPVHHYEIINIGRPGGQQSPADLHLYETRDLDDRSIYPILEHRRSEGLHVLISKAMANIARYPDELEAGGTVAPHAY